MKAGIGYLDKNTFVYKQAFYICDIFIILLHENYSIKRSEA